MKYATARAFRNALDTKLREQAGPGEDLARLQRRLAYERFLVRLFHLVGETWLVKGGYALELRLGGKARATKDLDFNAPGGHDLLGTLQGAAEQDASDFFRFQVLRPDRAQLAGPPEGGQRFRVQAYLDGSQPYATFLLDVGQGDLVRSAIDHLPARVDVTFAGLPAVTFPIYPLAEHFAEKIHAYTRPRPDGGRTRVKDLLDLSLLVSELGLKPSRHLIEVVQAVFAHYGTHPLPVTLPEPPDDWERPFQEIAVTLGHPVKDMRQARVSVQTLLDASRAEPQR